MLNKVTESNTMSWECRLKMYEIATEWYWMYQFEILNLIQDGNGVNSPNKDCMFMPDKWSGDNWRWFTERLG